MVRPIIMYHYGTKNIPLFRIVCIADGIFSSASRMYLDMFQNLYSA